MTRFVTLALTVAALLALPARAAEGPATAAVKAANDRVQQGLADYSKAAGEERKAAREKVRQAVESLLDFESLVKEAAGKHWAGMSAAHRKRFTDALRGVMQASYLSKMREQASVDVSKVTSEYVGEDKDDKGHTHVKTVLHAGDDSAKVEYVLAHGKHGYRAVDVLTEDQSLVETYREQIAALWPKGGFEKVAERLEKKRKSLEAKEDAPAAAKE